MINFHELRKGLIIRLGLGFFLSLFLYGFTNETHETERPQTRRILLAAHRGTWVWRVEKVVVRVRIRAF